MYAKVHKIHRENGWAYLACKRCGSSAKEIEVSNASSSSSKNKKQQTWKCKQHQEITAVGMRYSYQTSYLFYISKCYCNNIFYEPYLFFYFNECLNKFRFKVIVRVIDETGSASLLLFDDFVHKLCGVTCQELITKYGEAHEDYFPAELNMMVGKKILFRFHYSDWNITNNDHVYTVKMMSEEDIIIKAFKADFITEVISYKI